MFGWVTEFLYTHEEIVFIFYGVIVILLAVVFVTSWRKGRHVERENHYLEIQQNLMRQHYDTLQEQITLTRKFRHDIANHIYTLETLEQEGMEKETAEYKAYLTQQYEKLKQVGFCNDPLIDAVIYQKMKICKEKGITLDTELLTLRMETMEDFDRMQFFFELCDYGIQSVEDSQKENKKIHISAGKEAGYTLISCEICPVKKKKKREQFLLKGIQTIVEKYEGFLKVEQKEDTHCVQVAVKV